MIHTFTNAFIADVVSKISFSTFPSHPFSLFFVVVVAFLCAVVANIYDV